MTCRAGVPVLLPQIIEQRLALFEFFDVLAHGAFSVRKPSVGEGRQHSQARMVGGRRYFSETQGRRENLHNRNQPRQKPSLVIGLITACQPVTHAGKRLAQKGRGQLGALQTVRPTAECGRVGHAIRVLERRRRLFPGAVLHKAPPQRMTARQQAVMRVRERKQREESEGLPATRAATATDRNPIMMLVVRLLAAVPVADDRIAFTSRASPQDGLVAVSGPVRFKLVLRGRKWDKENRSSLGLCHRR